MKLTAILIFLCGACAKQTINCRPKLGEAVHLAETRCPNDTFQVGYDPETAAPLLCAEMTVSCPVDYTGK